MRDSARLPAIYPIHGEAAANVILSLDYPSDTARMRASVGELIDSDPLPFYTVWAPEERRVGGIYIRHEHRAYICLSGINVGIQTARLVQSWFTGGTTVGDWAVLPYAMTMATYVADQIPGMIDDIDRGRITEIGVAGHSFGGLVALAMAQRFRRIAQAMRISYSSFGTPQGWISTGTLPATGEECARWVTQYDPVPNLPPNYQNALTLHGLLPQGRSRALDAWVQPCANIQLTDDGRIVANAREWEPSDITIPDLRAIVDSRTYGFFGDEHRIELYYRRLRNFNARQAAPPPPPVVPTIRPRTPEPPTPQQREQGRQAANALIEVGREQNGVVVEIPVPARMRAVREGRVWYVVWLNRQIAIGPTRKKAQAIARHFNRFLRIYQGVGVSNSIDFLGALQDWLRDAANPEAGYRPTLEDAGMTP